MAKDIPKEPQYDAKTGKIRWNDEDYVIVFSRAEELMYGDKAHLLITPQPGEEPQPVRGGFVFAGRVFYLSSDQPDYNVIAAKTADMIKVARETRLAQARGRYLQPSSIPVELHPYILQEAAEGNHSRIIEGLLKTKKNFGTSYSAVDRVIGRYKREAIVEKQASQRPDLEAELAADRVVLNSTIDRMSEMTEYAFQQVAAGEGTLDKNFLATFRMARDTANVLNRKIRDTASQSVAAEMRAVRVEALHVKEVAAEKAEVRRQEKEPRWPRRPSPAQGRTGHSEIEPGSFVCRRDWPDAFHALRVARMRPAPQDRFCPGTASHGLGKPFYGFGRGGFRRRPGPRVRRVSRTRLPCGRASRRSCAARPE